MFAKALVALAPLVAFAAAEEATFTHYGAGDGWGSQNCKAPPADRPLACGIQSTNGLQGYSAAISQNVYGVGPGAGAGPGCGTCWTLTINADQNGAPVTQKTVNVTVNNLCPADGNNEWCNIPAGGTNQHGGQVHFDLCSDTGADTAFFTSVGAGKGTATQIQCGSGNAIESSVAAPSVPASTQPAKPTTAPMAPTTSVIAQSASSVTDLETFPTYKPTNVPSAPGASNPVPSAPMASNPIPSAPAEGSDEGDDSSDDSCDEGDDSPSEGPGASAPGASNPLETATNPAYGNAPTLPAYNPSAPGASSGVTPTPTPTPAGPFGGRFTPGFPYRHHGHGGHGHMPGQQYGPGASAPAAESSVSAAAVETGAAGAEEPCEEEK